MTLELLRTLVAPAVGILALGCLGPNPLLDAGGDGTDDATDDTSEVGDGDGDGDGDDDTDAGDGDTGDGDGDDDPCSNGVLDGDETDVDCGGSCPACDDGSACAAETDCASQVCAGSVCQAPSCEDQIQNGDEVGVDCGGSACGFCQFSQFWPELDDYQATPASFPQVAMFADHSFAITYAGPTNARARWFNELGNATGPSVELSDTISFVGGRVLPLVAGVGDDHPIHALVAGTDPMSTSTDLFLIRRTHAAELTKFRINAISQVVGFGGLTVNGSKATLSWQANTNQVLTRRLDYTVDAGSWTDISPFDAETEPGQFTGWSPNMARNSAGMTVVAWIRGGPTFDLAIRRFDGGWVDPAPVTAGDLSPDYAASNPRVAIAEDGRVAVAWTLVGPDVSGFGAWILDADLVPEGPSWILQPVVLPGGGTLGDVAALDDGSFAFVWPDNSQKRVHLRRFLSADTPKLTEVGDEAPWGVLGNSLASASIANVDGRAVVVWSGTADGVAQIQGQVLSY